ncbi:kelch motif family protein [Stylonychia lemnae]|uniref:Kelch motif family protein n=1 Tax=Stylonychia lemnae TaxID=5949 RepID=A0A078AZJ1_STYLE|nr:kelch motif family protein [Stylonychia lemnae]|eukprot:CDW87855.1 kelch motif family protein [Stylonychia lemnae]
MSKSISPQKNDQPSPANSSSGGLFSKITNLFSKKKTGMENKEAENEQQKPDLSQQKSPQLASIKGLRKSSTKAVDQILQMNSLRPNKNKDKYNKQRTSSNVKMQELKPKRGLSKNRIGSNNQLQSQSSDMKLPIKNSNIKTDQSSISGDRSLYFESLHMMTSPQEEQKDKKNSRYKSSNSKLQSHKIFGKNSVAQSPVGSIRHINSFIDQDSMSSNSSQSRQLRSNTRQKISTGKSGSSDRNSNFREQQSFKYQINVIPELKKKKSGNSNEKEKLNDKKSQERQSNDHNNRYKENNRQNQNDQEGNDDQNNDDSNDERRHLYIPTLDSIAEKSMEETKLELSRDKSHQNTPSNLNSNIANKLNVHLRNGMQLHSHQENGLLLPRKNQTQINSQYDNFGSYDQNNLSKEIEGSFVEITYLDIGGKKVKKKKKKQKKQLPPTVPKQYQSIEIQPSETQLSKILRQQLQSLTDQRFISESRDSNNHQSSQNQISIDSSVQQPTRSTLQLLTNKIIEEMGTAKLAQSTNPQQMIQKRLLELLQHEKYKNKLVPQMSNPSPQLGNEQQESINKTQEQSQQPQPQKQISKLAEFLRDQKLAKKQIQQDSHSTIDQTSIIEQQQQQQVDQDQLHQQQQQNSLKRTLSSSLSKNLSMFQQNQQDQMKRIDVGSYIKNSANKSAIQFIDTSLPDISSKSRNYLKYAQSNDNQIRRHIISNHEFDDKAFAFKSLDNIRREIDMEMSHFKKEIRQINLRCAAQGNDLIYQKQLLHKVKIELLDEREEEFKNLIRAFIELHEALDERMRELQKQYDNHIDKTINHIDGCMQQLDNLIIGLDDVQTKNRDFLLADKMMDDEKEKIDFFLKQEYPLKFRDINQKMQMIKLAKFEFPSFEVNTDKLRDSITRIGTFKVSSIANVNYGVQRFYNHKDPQDSQMIFQFKWNTKDVYFFDAAINKWCYIQEMMPKEPFLFFSSIVFLPKQLGTFILGGLDSSDNYSKRCLWFKKYKVFYEKCPMLRKRAFFSSLYSQIDCQIYSIGGYDGINDLATCEKYSLYENIWREIAPMNKPRNGSATLLLKHLKFIFALGGNSKKDGSLDSIERYDLEFDQWLLLELRLPMPMHDFQAIILQGNSDQDEYKLLLFGGQTNNEQYISKAQLLDISLEINRNPQQNIIKKLGKIYYPTSTIDQRRCYVFAGYSDELLQPYILDFKQFKIEKVKMQKQLDSKFGEGLVGKVENFLLNQSKISESDQTKILGKFHLDEKQFKELQDKIQREKHNGAVYHAENRKPTLDKILDKMKDSGEIRTDQSDDYFTYKGYNLKKQNNK